MREIEYRAWLKNIKKMVEVEEINFINEEIRFKDYETPFTKPIEINVSFEDVELMQYTGLKDKNGVKIFEGYIVKIDEEEICFIEWDEYDYFYRIKNKEVDDIFSGFRPKDLEVIGNIYENPELLEVEE